MRPPLDIPRCRKALLDPERISTHYAECEYSHVRCALSLALAEMEVARRVVAAARDVTDAWPRGQSFVEEGSTLSRLHYAVEEHDRAIGEKT